VKNTKSAAILCFLIFAAAVPLLAQSETELVNSKLEALLDSALSYAEQGNWDQAHIALNDAEKIDPGDPRISSYRTSIQELQALDDAQMSWVAGDPSEVKDSNTEADSDGTDEEESPKFVIDKGDKDPRNNPAAFRDTLRLDMSIKFFAVNPQTSETVNTWSSWNEFFYASLGADIRYWMPFLGRSLGFNFRSSGYSWAPGEPSLLFNSLDLGINLRGFLLESALSRLEIGVDFGASLHSFSDSTSGKEITGALFLGLWASDPLLFHIFKAESLQNLVFSGGLRIYSSTTDVILETINYRLEGAWYFKHGYTGIRLEWWDFSIDTGPITMLSFSLFGGYRY
jgi:hypothetical protein